MKQQTICAKVNPRLLTKADRLFTGTIEGRIIELIQNARRAGATEVRIINKDKLIIVEDNGCGIQDVQKLLDLGGSGWDQHIESGEDPAGVGLFSLAPRQVTIISETSKIVITKNGWTGSPVEVTAARNYQKGTRLEFNDEKPWNISLVEKFAVFAGIRVIVDGKLCHAMPFCGNDAASHEDIGCHVEILPEISKYHKLWNSSCYSHGVLVNFHGQVVKLDYWPGIQNSNLYILVDLDQKTQVRLMLPARTCLVENNALQKLKEAIEIEYYRYFKRQKEHKLYYREYLRAKELGIDLPEATPVYRPGLIHDSYDMAVQVMLPKDFCLSQGYLYSSEDVDGGDYAETNAHILGSIGTFTNSFVPVTIDSGYMGYRWTKLPGITSVEIDAGTEMLRRSIQAGELVCVESLSITVKTSDGKMFSSQVSMAISSEKSNDQYNWFSDIVYVTKEAREHLDNVNIWFHLGGYSDDGDTFETQEHYFTEEIAEFWNELIGPHESLRQKLMHETWCLKEEWSKITLTKDGDLEINFANGKKEYVRPA